MGIARYLSKLASGLSSEGVLPASKGGTGTTTGGGSGSGGPKITNIQVTDSSYTNLDDTAVDIAGGYVKIIGSGFETGCQVLIGSTLATSVAFVSATEVRAQVPATAAGTYIVYLVNSDGGTAIRVNGVTFSTTPTWTSTSPIAGIVSTAISVQLTATGASTFSVAAGSTLPAGLTLSSSGLLSGTITGITENTTYNFTILATDTELQDSPQTFALNISAAKDPYFNYTTLLLPGATTTFVDDASTNNFAITIAGDTKPNSFGPYTPGYYSNYFDGTGDYLTHDAIALGSTFTIECWIYKTNTSSTFAIILGNGAASWFSVAESGLVFSVGGSTYPYTGTFLLNTWNHIALVNNAGTLSSFINGIKSVTTYTGMTSGWTQTYVGQFGNVTSYPFAGYISNLRVINGTAVYTANFTPSTTPLTAISGTSLLTCQSNRFSDTSTNAFTITAAGNTSVSSFDPFVPNASYSTYGSAYFDGTGDYIRIAGSVLNNSAFTISFYFYPTTSSVVGLFDSAPNQTSCFRNYPANSIQDQNGGTVAFTPLVNQWNWMSIVGDGTNFTVYLNGSSVGSAAYAGLVDSNFTIGAINNGGDGAYTGYISNFRVKNIASVDSVPTSPLTAVANTSLLTLQNNQPTNNSTFLDSSSNNFAITRVGNTTQGTFSPYGANWSNYFDGTGDYLQIANDPSNQMGTGDWTAEAWVYLTSYTLLNPIFAKGGSTTDWFIGTYPTTGRLYIGIGLTDYFDTTGPVVPLYQWCHIALVRNGSSQTTYLNGVVGNTRTTAANYVSTGPLNIGRGRDSSSSYLSGYISNARIVKGTAVYTANFTPPTTPLTPITNTSLLTCADNRLVDDSINNSTITKYGDVSVQRFSPFSPSVEYSPSTIGGSAYFDGSGDYITVPNNTNIDLGSGNFTIELWVYLTSSNTNFTLFQKPSSYELKVDTSRWVWQINGNNNVFVTNGTLANNTWTHVAMVRNGTTTTLYLNGVSYTSGTSVDAASNSNGLNIGSGTSAFGGYITDFRLVKSNALYTSNFVPPAQPLTAVQNTTLLCNFTGASVYDATMLNNLETVGDAKLSHAVSKFGGTSMSFDGTGDYLICPDSLNQEFGSGNLTWEMWVNTTNLASFSTLYSRTPASFSTGMWALMMNHSASSAGDVALYIGDYSTTGPLLLTTGVSIRDGNWHHVAVVRNGSAWAIYVDGTSRATATWAGTIANIAGNPYIGADQFYGRAFNGYIDDFRITKGVARYTSNFTAPAIAHHVK